MTQRQQDSCNRLRIADLDADRQRAWIDEAPARAAGYRLVGWVGATPDEWVEWLARALDAMVDAPTDDLDWQPQRVSATQVLEADRAVDAAGYDMVRTLALAPDGSAAGMSELMASACARRSPARATRAWSPPTAACGWGAGSRPRTCGGPSTTSRPSRSSRRSTPPRTPT